MNPKYEKVILIAVCEDRTPIEHFERSLLELKSLVKTAGGIVVDTLTQNRHLPDRVSYFGKGKLDELQKSITIYDADLVIANHELTPLQQRNLVDSCNLGVLDRTTLILDIFAMRARSKAGKLQVEYAQVKHLLPRLVGNSKALSKLGGGIGTRGPGETKLEMDRRRLRDRLHKIKQELKELEKRTNRYYEKLHEKKTITVALIGYTNAGKSTLFNQLTEANVYTKDELFATLDATLRRLILPCGLEVVLSDTVGLIMDFPTTMIEAFQATISNVKEADLLLHVVDMTDDNFEKDINVVDELLKTLDAQSIPRVLIFNKQDLLKDHDHFLGLECSFPKLFVSALNLDDIINVKHFIEDQLKQSMMYYQKELSQNAGKELAYLKECSIVDEIKFDEENAVYICKGWAYHDFN